jgi:hypothetical protein
LTIAGFCVAGANLGMGWSALGPTRFGSAQHSTSLTRNTRGWLLRHLMFAVRGVLYLYRYELLDHLSQSRSEAAPVEVYKIPAKRMLTAKALSRHLLSLQDIPKFSFCLGSIATQATSFRRLLGRS